MSAHDVPGAVAANGDTLRMGAWAEHEDGSLIFVYSTEASRVVFTMFDTHLQPMIEYRTAMAEGDFKREFSWTAPPGGAAKDAKKDTKWTWHDKTPFPWDRIIGQGAKAGPRFSSAEALMSAAARVARSMGLRGVPSDLPRENAVEFERMSPRDKASWLIKRMQDVLNDLPE